MLNLNGSGVALITPFNLDNTINYNKISQLIEYHIKNKTDFIVVCGTTGESATLSLKEKKELIRFVVEKVNKRIPVIAGTGSNNTSSAISLSTYAKSVGVDGLLVVTPYYNKGNEEGIYMHYEKIANAVSPLPILLYNVPSRTGLNLKSEAILSLAKIDNIIGIKEADTDIVKISSLLFELKQSNLDFKVFSGNDNLTLPILLLGGSGVISVCANIIPNQMHDICSNLDLELYSKYYNLMNALFIDVNPIMIKEAMNIMGMDVGTLRLPLYNTNKTNLSILKNELETLNLINN